MSDRKKFEEMLERLVNEDREGAEELFHEIVVEKSRSIYEALLAEEEKEEDEEVDEANDEEVDESDEELDESEDEEVDESDDDDLDESDDEEVDEGFFGEADPTDDMVGDISMPGMGGDDEMGMDAGDDTGMDDMGMDGGEGDLENRVMDLEDELEALKAEFEAMMGDEEGGDEGDMDMDMDMDMGGDDEEEEDEDEDEEEEEKPAESFNFGEQKSVKKSQAELMREYANKVSPAKMGDNGTNTKSPLAKPNKMGGGTTANILNGGESTSGGTQGGLLNPTKKDMNTKNVNVVGGGKSASKLNAQPKGHGAEKKGSGDMGDKSANSPLNGLKSRSK